MKRFRQAVEIAGARRIGHGVDVFYEDRSFALLEHMRDDRIAVEICLTSNDVILGGDGDGMANDGDDDLEK